MALDTQVRNRLEAILDPSLVMFLHVSARDEAIEALVSLLQAHGHLPDRELFKRAILEREQLVSTGIGLGVAVPHAKLACFESFFIAIGIQQGPGIEWQSIDRSPVRLVFMIGGPDNQQTEYLHILSELTAAIRDPEVRKELSVAQDSAQIVALLNNGWSETGHAKNLQSTGG